MSQHTGPHTTPPLGRDTQAPHPDHIACLLSISRLAGSASGPTEKANESLAALRSIVPYQAASISVWDPLTQEHQTRANAGYPGPVTAHLDGPFVRDDELYRMARAQNARPLRWQDVPFDYRERYSARSVFIPTGFDEGTSAPLMSSDNRYTGVLHISVDDRAGINDEAIASLVWLQTLLSPVVDELRSWSRLLERNSPECSAMLISDTAAVDLPDHPWRWHSQERNALIGTVHRNWRTLERGFTQLLWPTPLGRWMQLWVYRVGSRNMLVIEELLTGPPYTLTEREMAVVAEIASGGSNKQLAARLGVSVRTVAKHIENIMQKTSATSRTELCARAYREGFLMLANLDAGMSRT